MKYSIVIPTYNHCEDLLKPCIESIIKYTSLDDLEVIVVANGCVDNTREYVESLGHPFKLIWFDEALGYTKAINAGIKVAKGDYVLLLNNDIVILHCPKDFWINHLQLPFVDNPKMALTGSLKLFDHDIQRDFIVFCNAMIKREMFDIIGMPDEIFSPGYGEDIDFSMRVLEKGYEWKCIDETTLKGGTNVGWFPIWHRGTQTFKDIPEYGKVVVPRNIQILKDRYNKKLAPLTKESSMKYSIVIPTYNHCEDFLKPCIESIFKYSVMSEVELIIVANGCTDSTREYLDSLQLQFNQLGFNENLKVVWSDTPLGYPKACNRGIRQSTTKHIVLLNNDTALLTQTRSSWLNILHKPFTANDKVGISAVVKQRSDAANRDIALLFCVMISRAVFENIGLLNEEYGIGFGEDAELTVLAENAGFEVVLSSDSHWRDDTSKYTGAFPIYHRGQGTVRDTDLVSNIQDIMLRNELKVAKKYNLDWYRVKVSNNYERAVFLKGDSLWPNFPREHNRYAWASSLLVGKKVLEIGCSTGFGTQYLPQDAEYTGLDYDNLTVDIAKEQGWGDNFKFVHADINQFELGMYDTIIAFEVIEHLPNGIEVVERLKKHCKRLIISVPYKEPPGFWGHYHVLHGLDETHFPGFKYVYCADDGTLSDTINENSRFNLLLMTMDCN